jgi:hypothetical protein
MRNPISSPDWHERTIAKIGLRAAGLVILMIAYWAGATLYRRFAGSLVHPPVEYLLALVVTVCTCVGTAMTVMGHHLFDQVEVSGRWARRLPPTYLHSPEDLAEMSASGPEDTSGERRIDA